MKNKEMARQRELLSLTDIAEETGISYATLRNYVIKYGDEIPSEGFGRDTRYPRPAVKVFQRLRKESKPGRKPANPLAAQAPQAPAVPASLLRREPPAPVPSVSAPMPPMPAMPTMPTMPPITVTVDTSAIERELAAIRVQLERIADARVEALQRRNARLEAAATVAAVPTAPVAPIAAVPAAPPAEAQAQEPSAQAPAALSERREGVRDLETARNSGYPYRDNRARSRHAWPAAPGRKGPRPE
jgi:hypothetical protein